MKVIGQMLTFNVMRGVGTRRCCPEVLKSQHSLLVLARAPIQGCSSPFMGEYAIYGYS
jgi:hypothetical protein